MLPAVWSTTANQWGPASCAAGRLAGSGDCLVQAVHEGEAAFWWLILRPVGHDEQRNPERVVVASLRGAQMASRCTPVVLVDEATQPVAPSDRADPNERSG